MKVYCVHELIKHGDQEYPILHGIFFKLTDAIESIKFSWHKVENWDWDFSNLKRIKTFGNDMRITTETIHHQPEHL